MFGYGLVGPALRGSSHLDLAVACSDAHEALRDSTEDALAAAGVTPDPPAADYPDLYPVTSVAQASALALRLEQDCADAWRYFYAALATGKGNPSRRELRVKAQDALNASAVRALRWRVLVHPAAPTDPFPGL